MLSPHFIIFTYFVSEKKNFAEAVTTKWKLWSSEVQSKGKKGLWPFCKLLSSSFEKSGLKGFWNNAGIPTPRMFLLSIISDQEMIEYKDLYFLLSLLSREFYQKRPHNSPNTEFRAGVLYYSTPHFLPCSLQQKRNESKKGHRLQ